MHTIALSVSLCLSFAACAVQPRPQQPQNPAPAQQNPQQPTPAPTQQNPQQPTPAPTQPNAQQPQTPAPAQQNPQNPQQPQKPATAPKPGEKPPEQKPTEQKPGEPQKPGQGKDAAKAAIPPEKLEQLVAPIALYPDGLLSQTLMAATYPLEIVQAARWLEKNKTLKGDALEKALQDQTWDPSVKSLCGLPTVLKRMDENLDWTQDLGDAFLADQSALMDTVQKMRRKAKDSGKLETTKEQKVSEREDKIIVIEPADPETVYVPTYYPTAVYGGWSYPVYYYPPMYPAYPPAYPAFTFAVGVAWGAAIWGGCSWGWGHSECNVNINHYNNFTGRTENNFNRDRVQQRPTAGNTGRGNNSWQHNPSHRQGVRYGDKGTADRYRPSTSDRSARGYGQDRAGTRPSTGATRPSTGNPRPSTGATRPSTGNTGGTRPSTSQSGGQRSGSFSGSRSPSADRAASQRGSTSRGSSSRSGASRGGGGRSGGGGRGGGGRR